MLLKKTLLSSRGEEEEVLSSSCGMIGWLDQPVMSLIRK